MDSSEKQIINLLKKTLNKIELLERQIEELRGGQEKANYMTVEKAAEHYGVSKSVIYAWKKTGKIKSYKNGKRLLVSI